MERSFLQRLLQPLAEIRSGEAGTALMMFAYSFLAMTSYNIIQPLTRSKLISSLGAVNIPYVIFGAGLLIGVLMLAYTRFYSAAAAPVGAADLTGRDGRGHAHLLDVVPDQACVGRLGLGRLLRLGQSARASLSSANSGPSPTASTIPGRPSGCSGSSAAASCSAA